MQQRSQYVLPSLKEGSTYAAAEASPLLQFRCPADQVICS